MELASIVEEPSACASMAMAQVAGFLASSNYRVSPRRPDPSKTGTWLRVRYMCVVVRFNFSFQVSGLLWLFPRMIEER
jgi:hypothetical protein